MKSLSALRLICVWTLAAVLGAWSARAADFCNGGFETGSFDGWTENGGYWFGETNYPADYYFTDSPYQSAIVEPGDVPCLASLGVSVSQVRSGSHAARINSNDTYIPGGAANSHFSQIQQTVSGWNSPYFSFDWSAVLQDSGHARENRPHFRIILEDLTTATTIYNIAYYSDNLPPDMVQRTGPFAEDWAYTGWHHVQLNTPSLTGDTLMLTILAADCAQGGHDGALYVDNIMGAPTTGNELPVAVPVVRPNPVPAGTTVTLDGTGSHDSENDTIDLYDWDFDGDGVTDLSGEALQAWTIPSSWAPGTYTLNLRVREQLPAPMPAQWSPWVPVTLTVLGPPDACHSTVSPATASITANGQSTQVITVQARDVNNNALNTGGEPVVISLSSGSGAVSSTTDNGNGTYTAKVTSPPTPGSGTFTATMGVTAVGTEVGAQQSVVTYFSPSYLRTAITSTNNVVVWWALSETSWCLQATTELVATGSIWTDLSHQTNGATCYRIVSPSDGNKFYRLRQP
jgi:hypothetical protein